MEHLLIAFSVGNLAKKYNLKIETKIIDKICRNLTKFSTKLTILGKFKYAKNLFNPQFS